MFTQHSLLKCSLPPHSTYFPHLCNYTSSSPIQLNTNPSFFVVTTISPPEQFMLSSPLRSTESTLLHSTKTSPHILSSTASALLISSMASPHLHSSTLFHHLLSSTPFPQLFTSTPSSHLLSSRSSTLLFDQHNLLRCSVQQHPVPC